MAKADQSVQQGYGRGSIFARVIDAEEGLHLLSGVSAIRVRSKGYNLLIMEDYLPTLGKLEGDIAFLTENGEEFLENIRGFYKHQHNEFTLLIQERGKPEEEIP